MVLDYDENNRNSSADGLMGTGGAHIEEGCIAWDRHSSRLCAVGYGKDLKLVDTREMEVTSTKTDAHDGNIRWENIAWTVLALYFVNMCVLCYCLLSCCITPTLHYH